MKWKICLTLDVFVTGNTEHEAIDNALVTLPVELRRQVHSINTYDEEEEGYGRG